MIDVKFEGFINGVRTFDWGVVYEVAHAQMMKDEQGEWKVAGKDYFSVTGPAGFEEGDKVAISGSLKTKTFDKKDGSKGVALNVRARDMVKVERRNTNKTSVAAVNEVWPTIDIPSGLDEQAPF
jgi:hypothetical protein